MRKKFRITMDGLKVGDDYKNRDLRSFFVEKSEFGKKKMIGKSSTS